MAPRALFMPGASGLGEFWDPVRTTLRDVDSEAIDWPGLGGVPANPGVAGFGDLVAYTAARLDRPTALVAQSMGGVVAVRLAAEHPELVTHLVLSATSGGIDVTALGAADWRPGARLARPLDPDWLFEPTPDMTESIRAITQSGAAAVG